MTLGSLLGESIDRLEALNIIPDTDEDEEALVQGGDVDEESHIPTIEERMGGVEGPGVATSATQPASQQLSEFASSRMQNRGMPYFEEMVENSRLGRIKRQKGGHTSRDGSTSVQWEVVEIGGDEPTPMEAEAETETGSARSKRQKTDG